MAGGIVTKANDLDIAEELIQRWIKRHPREWELFKQAVLIARSELKDPKFGEGDDKRMRKIGMFPEPAQWNGKRDYLLEQIQGLFPDFFKKEGQKVRVEFFRRFGALRVAERV